MHVSLWLKQLEDREPGRNSGVIAEVKAMQVGQVQTPTGAGLHASLSRQDTCTAWKSGQLSHCVGHRSSGVV